MAISEKEWLEEFSENLQSLMRESDINQTELSVKSGVSKSTINKYLNGLQMPTAANALNLSYALDCSIDDLIDFGDPVR